MSLTICIGSKEVWAQLHAQRREILSDASQKGKFIVFKFPAKNARQTAAAGH